MGVMTKHVLKAASGRLSYRRTYPPDLRPFIPNEGGQPPRELKVSLGTKDPNSAEFHAGYGRAAARYAVIVGKAERLKAGAYDPLDAPSIAYLAKHFEIEWMGLSEAALWEKGPDWAESARNFWNTKYLDFLEMRAEGNLDAIESEWRDAARKLLSSRGWTADPADQDGFRELCKALNDVAISMRPTVYARMAGAVIPTPPAPSAPSRKAASVPLLATFDEYAKRAELSPRVAQDWRRPIVHLVAFLGHDDATKLSRKDLMDWRDALLDEPSKKGGKRKPRTVRDKYIGAVKAMLNWAVDEGRLATNEATKLVVKVPKAVKARERSFTMDEATAILSRTFDVPAPNLSAPHARARRWVPWLCAYSGARVNELTQLRAQDVEQVDGVWTINITPEAGTVKNKEARRIPLHPHIIEQGFLKMVESIGAGPLFYDPEKLRVPGAANRHVMKVGERLGEWVRNTVGITDPGLQPNHAWRHLFKTMSYTIGMEERMADAIQGHASTTEGRKYGMPPLPAVAACIARIPRFAVRPL
jgi:integrase